MRTDLSKRNVLPGFFALALLLLFSLHLGAQQAAEKEPNN